MIQSSRANPWGWPKCNIREARVLHDFGDLRFGQVLNPHDEKLEGSISIAPILEAIEKLTDGGFNLDRVSRRGWAVDAPHRVRVGVHALGRV